VRKAILKKQNYIELKDGSYGMLPEEWIAQYAQLFRFAKVDDKKGTLRLSKQHFTILERYKEFIENPQLIKELDEKRNKLLNFTEIKKVKLPKNVKAQLRPYQEEGYKWLNFLDEFGWGGCLADDMGLGKTLQMLTFLQEMKNRKPKGVHLVVVPKTLIFNWQAEATKFCPDLRLYVHGGPQRVKDTRVFEDYDIVLTTYGTARSDVELLGKFKFHYIILDESQAIKNPDSMVSKAVKLLNAQNRLVMTGTPVENNTFDLYSQLDFLNPGFLGHEDFFRTEYATPIDKYQDKNRAAELRRLIYPFMLKRTKEEVAKDLPEKTEMVLYCEMDKRQRKVYEAMRDKYRDLIAGRMAEVGREQAAFLILEGLLKLRQICDSPALLSDDEDYGTESVKLDEIVREIEENASHHKIVIFSQFLKMLDLIKAKLERDRIPYEYLDGQTQDRAERVNRFQGDQECRVFLMSLKAGGVGLNLTEADYVYLVDPWWNPAVEQQAIDRVHRIGQTKRVFAYRMICKDTIEEKIIQLQDRKRALADDLISTEAGFLKKLTKDDIMGLFS
jgi:non-specific serine/threonine protein kinase